MIMRLRLPTFSVLSLIAVLALPRLSDTIHAAPPPTRATPAKPATNAAPAQLDIPKSVFVVPTSLKEGRDPFFPNSTREYGSTDGKAVKAPTSAEAMLDLKGFSGVGGHRLAIINNHTFGAGEEGEVNTPAGRIRIRCVQIKDDSVVVEIGGETREIQFRVKK